jgi:hypothetical protein
LSVHLYFSKLLARRCNLGIFSELGLGINLRFRTLRTPENT